MRCVVQDLDVHGLRPGCGIGILAGTRVAHVAGVRAGGDLEADLVPGGEAVGSRPQIESHVPRPIVAGLEPSRRDPHQGVTDVPGGSGLIDVADAGEHVEVGRAGTDRQLDPDRADRFNQRLEGWGRVREDVRTGLELAVVDDRLALQQKWPSERRRGIGGVVAIAIEG